MAVSLDRCTECWVLLMMSSTGNDVWGAALYCTVCVWGRGGGLYVEGRGGGVWGERSVCVCKCLCLHSTADAWAVLYAMDPHPLPLAYVHT